MGKTIELPVMQCDPNCTDCCGPVMCQPKEYAAVIAYAAEHGIEPKRQGLTCPWYQNGRCTVYSVRPFVCRLFGHVPRMQCSHGYNVNISEFWEQRLNHRYLSAGQPTRWLHEALLGECSDTELPQRLAAVFEGTP